MAKEKDESQAEEKAIQHAWDSVEKDFGKGSVMHGQTIIRDVEAIPTGSLRLDIALGIGGVPRGRITEIYGPEASGKTTLCMEIVKNVQAEKGRAMFVDVENAFDSAYAKRINLDMDKLYLSQPNSGEQALTIVERFVASNAMDLIVIDSVAGLVPQAELEGDLIDKQMGAQAALMSKALRKLAPIVNKTKTCVIFTNQLREKIGVMFGNPETTSGGRALKYWASVRIERQGRRRCRRHHRPRQGPEEQGRPAVPPGRIQARLWEGNPKGSLYCRHGGAVWYPEEGRRLDLLQGRKDWERHRSSS